MRTRLLGWLVGSLSGLVSWASWGQAEVGTVEDTAVSATKAFRPFFEDGRLAQDLATYIGLPYHSIFVQVFWTVGLPFLLIGLIVLLWRAVTADSRGMLKHVFGLILVLLVLIPVNGSADWVQRSLYHNGGAGAPHIDLSTGEADQRELQVALGVVVFSRVVNFLEGGTYNLLRDATAAQRRISPLGVYREMDIAYFSLFGEESLLAPIRDYYRLCGNVRTLPGAESVDDGQWDAVSLNGTATFGREWVAGRRDLKSNPFFNFARAWSSQASWVTGKVYSPLAKLMDQVEGYAEGWDRGEDARALLAGYNPYSCGADCAMNERGYRPPDSTFWKQRLTTAAEDSVPIGTRTIDWGDRFQHPKESGAPGAFATNCLELFEIADAAVTEVYEADPGYEEVSITDDLMSASRSARMLGIVTGLNQRISNFTDAENEIGSRTLPGQKIGATDMGALARSIDAGLKEFGLFKKAALALPDAVMMAIGISAFIPILVILLLPIVALASVIFGATFPLETSFRLIIMGKLVALIMYVIIQLGSAIGELLLGYWEASAVINYQTTYPILPLVYTARTGTLLMALGLPPVLAYMLAFSNSKALGGVSTTRPGSTLTRDGMQVVGTGVGLAMGASRLGMIANRGTTKAAGAAGVAGGGGGGGPIPSGTGDFFPRQLMNSGQPWSKDNPGLVSGKWVAPPGGHPRSPPGATPGRSSPGAGRGSNGGGAQPAGQTAAPSQAAAGTRSQLTNATMTGARPSVQAPSMAGQSRSTDRVSSHAGSAAHITQIPGTATSRTRNTDR